jgi:hypothetical protein
MLALVQKLEAAHAKHFVGLRETARQEAVQIATYLRDTPRAEWQIINANGTDILGRGTWTWNQPVSHRKHATL